MKGRSRKKRKPKADTQKKHARLRALQRYGFELTGGLESKLKTLMAEGKTTLVERQSLRVTVHDVELDGKELRFVYDSKRHQVVTFLYKEASQYLEGHQL